MYLFTRIFTEEYRTGISFVDKEQKELFRIIGDVNESW